MCTVCGCGYVFQGEDSSRLRSCFLFFQAEDGIRDLVRSRGLGDVYKRQVRCFKCESYAFVLSLLIFGTALRGAGHVAGA